MVYNGLISNTDDHPRNHAALAMGDLWGLSPAYDLTPTSSVSIERRDLAMICGGAGRYANAENMLSECARFLLSPDEAVLIISGMKERAPNLVRHCAWRRRIRARLRLDRGRFRL